MKRVTLVFLILAILVTVLTPVTELASPMFYNIMYWSSIILYIIVVVLIIKEERDYGWPYQD